MAGPLRYDVLVADDTIEVFGADAYAPDGSMTTFYRCRDGREVIDAWATRISSFRTIDIVRIVRIEEAAVAC